MINYISTVRHGGLLNVILNRPEKANALTHEMLDQLWNIFDQTQRDKEIHVVVISSSSERVFCAGADLTKLHNIPEDVWESVAVGLNSLEQLTIASINGPCVGGGLTLALGCDIRIGVDDAYFSYPVLHNNVLPGPTDHTRLIQLIGPARSAFLLLGGVQVSMTQALNWGLVEKIVTKSELITVIQETSQAALRADREHLAKLKLICRGEIC